MTEKMFEPLATTEIGLVAVAEDFETKYDAAQATLHVFLDGQTLNFQPNNDRQQFELKSHWPSSIPVASSSTIVLKPCKAICCLHVRN
jgi:hypothetical protein